MSLARALSAVKVVGSTRVSLAKLHPGHLVGSGKLDELAQQFHDDEVELVIVNGRVSPVQQRNLEKAWKLKVLDRTGLILEIFGDRARTREGVLQVEMAALSYQRTRLVRAWTHLERQRGGLGFVGGPGETQIEADRRAIDEQLNRIKKRLEKLIKTRQLHRASRAKVPFPIVALVGYTNAGKSTLFNVMTGANALAKDMLFATLDPTLRSTNLPNGEAVILADTVGFISELPTELVAAFRATLEEVIEADVILHVRDIAHPESNAQKLNVESILESLGVSDEIPMIEVWNKRDLLPEDDVEGIARLAEREDNIELVSATTGQGLGTLYTALSAVLKANYVTDTIRVSHASGKQRAWLFEHGVVQRERPSETDVEYTVYWNAELKGRYFALPKG